FGYDKLSPLSNLSRMPFLFIIIGLLSCPLFSYGQKEDIIRVMDNRQLFVDHYLIDTLINTKLVMHHPHDEGAVFSFDKPWEGPFCNYVTIIKDGNLFRAYYRGSQGGKDGNDSEVTCLAESL